MLLALTVCCGHNRRAFSHLLLAGCAIAVKESVAITKHVNHQLIIFEFSKITNLLTTESKINYS